MQKTANFLIIFGILLLQTVCNSSINAQTVGYREVIINEIMADPSPAVSDIPEVEYVEIFNRSESSIDLTGWTLKDASNTQAVFPPTTLESGEYAIICKETEKAFFERFGKVIGTPKWPVLNNDKDSVILRNSQGELIDALYYSDSWYKDSEKKKGGWALELINPALSCSDSENWIASSSSNGGTPGTANSVLDNTPDTIPPLLFSYSVQDSKTILLSFSEPVDIITSENPNLYILSPNVEIQTVLIAPDAKNITLLLESEMQKGIEYTLRILGISDCEGNSTDEILIEIFLGDIAEFNDVIITEIMADPTPSAGLPEEEYIEIYNRSIKIIDLKGMIFTAGSRSAEFPEGQLLPGEYAAVVPEEAAELFDRVPKVIGLSKFPTLANTGATLSLSNQNQEIIFSLTYSDSWYETANKKEGGWSLEMIDLTQPCADAINWKESESEIGGTPAAQNSVDGFIEQQESLKPLALEYLSDRSIQILFSGKLHPAFTDKVQIEVIPFLEIEQINFKNQSGNQIEIIFAEPISEQEKYEISIQGFYDCDGREMEAAKIALGKPTFPEPGDIILNELLYDPLTGGEDFIELLNISSKILSLSDLVITREDPITGVFVNQLELSEYKRLIFPGDYLVLSAKGENVRSQYHTPGAGVFTDISKFPNYVNDGGIVGVYSNDGVLLDRLEYDPKMHYRVLKSTKGVSLERINPKVPADERTNWNSASLSVGGATPGYQNSQFLIPVPKGSLSVTPEIFSPDGDGYDDVLGVSYQLDQTDYVGSAAAYTIDGIPARKIFKNQTLSQNGFFTWDGLDDNGKKARVGIYVIVLEVFDLNGRKELLRTKCVLAGR